jgi:hypothetical protein
MPIENAAVLWPEQLSPRVPVATLHIPRQRFDSAAQFEFANNLSYSPWHGLPAHRPLGNQSRARLRMYRELSALRQRMNATPHVEPTGNEVFDGPSGGPIAAGPAEKSLPARLFRAQHDGRPTRPSGQ